MYSGLTFSQHLVLYMAPNQRRCNRKSDFSDTFELGRGAYREIVEQYQEVLTQPNFHHLAIRYVDNRFVIVQKHHLQAPVFKVFTDLDFYGSPVELELVADNLLLGFYFDVSERSVIYKLPDIRQIRDNVSAGTLRLRLSGLKSRAHLIRKYSFPSCQSQSSLHALARLHVQKGFALSDIHSALWPTTTSGDRPSCVGSTPVSKGFANFSIFQYFSFKAGGRPTCTADSLFHSTWCCMAPNQRRCNRKSDFSDTFELGRDAYREIVEQYQEVLTQPNFHHPAIRYVDNRFVIVQKHHLQAPVFKVFTDLDFYGSPVELELVADNLLLGFYFDVSERTVIYKLPDIRQIRDNVSAGTLRLRLSGLKSRAHLIRKYSFPSCQAQSSLHALSRLYVQKGFALSDIHSALWPTTTSGDRPSCVGSTPVSKGFANFSIFQYFSFSVLRQGVQAAHSVLHQRRHWMSAGDI